PRIPGLHMTHHSPFHFPMRGKGVAPGVVGAGAVRANSLGAGACAAATLEFASRNAATNSGKEMRGRNARRCGTRPPNRVLPGLLCARVEKPYASGENAVKGLSVLSALRKVRRGVVGDK